MFSPYYAWARRRGRNDPLDHCALNVALYTLRGGKRWAMTERRRNRLQRAPDSLAIGPSQLRWDGNALHIDIDELTVPFPSRIRGSVRVYPSAMLNHVEPLDPLGRHRWRPIAPCARVEVRMVSPALRWTGEGYLDCNSGDAPVEDTIARWHWSRSSLRNGTAVIYDVEHRGSDGRAAGRETVSLALHFDRRGNVEPFDLPLRTPLPKTGWRMVRQTRAEAGAATLTRTLEDTPFYARSVIASRLLRENVTGVHESLDLERFRQPLVQAMLPFRMPRRRS